MSHSHDRIDPVCKMTGHIHKHGYYFCSENCVKVYEESYEAPKWYENKLLVVSALIPLLVVAFNFHPATKPVFDAFAEYFKSIWWALLLGLFAGGVIDYFVPDIYISKHLSGRGKTSILKAVSLGFLMSTCSHGILAISIELYKKGASVASVVAFLLASPWANLTVTVLLFGFFGFNALYFVVSALVVAILTGFIFQILDSKNLIEKNPMTIAHDEEFSVRQDLYERFKNYKFTSKNISRDLKGVFDGAMRLNTMIIGWISIGMFAAALGRVYIPNHIFNDYFGPSLFGLAVTLITATIIEVCSEGSAPLAFEIFRQSGAFGNAFTFLMAGVVTDYTEIGLLWSNIGKKTAMWLPIVTVPQVLILGYLFNVLL